MSKRRRLRLASPTWVHVVVREDDLQLVHVELHRLSSSKGKVWVAHLAQTILRKSVTQAVHVPLLFRAVRCAFTTHRPLFSQARTMDEILQIAAPAKDFVQNSIRLINKCTKPDKKGAFVPLLFQLTPPFPFLPYRVPQDCPGRRARLLRHGYVAVCG